MKRAHIFWALLLGLFISFAVPSSSQAAAVNTASNPAAVHNNADDEALIYSKIVTRLSEIQSMDKTNLTKAEKKGLRKELKDMKKAAEGLNSRVYLSVGAIIIIILLLILILR